MHAHLRSFALRFTALLLALSPSAFALNAPTTINYQGRLKTAGGDPVPDGSYDVVFTIYDAAAAGNSKWTETRSITTTDGLFTVLLGSVNPIEDTVLNGPARYLGVKVETDPEITPRTMMVTAPYAMRVSTVDGASGGVVADKPTGKNSASLCTQYEVLTATNGNYGTSASIAGVSRGVLGSNSNGNFGQLGSPTEGAYGENGVNNSFGGLGTTIAGVQGYSGSLDYGGYFNTTEGTAGYFENLNHNKWATIADSGFAFWGKDEASGFAGSIGASYSGVSGYNGSINTGSLGTSTWGVTGYSWLSPVCWGALGGPDAAVRGSAGTQQAGEFGNAGTGLDGCTIHAENIAAAGIVSFFENNSSDATSVMTNNNTAGSVLKCFGPAGALPLIVKANGRVGINTSSPSQELAVSGDICYTGSIGACSDRRYKKDIVGISGSLDKVLKMRGVTYRWKKNEFPDQHFDDDVHLGFIAQELEELYPEVVMTDDNGYESVDYSRLTPVLVEAIKEQQQQIDELKNLVSQLLAERSRTTFGQK